MPLRFDPTAHAYHLDGQRLPSITQVIGATGLHPLDGIPADRLAEAAARGTAAHLACALHDRGTLDVPALHPSIEPYWWAWQSFLADTAFAPDPAWIERPLAHPAYRFAGTPDRVGRYRGDPTVVELKCTYDLAPATALQTAAQALLCEANGHRIIRRFAVKLQPDGRYQFREYRDPSDGRVFLAALTTHHWRAGHGLAA